MKKENACGIGIRFMKFSSLKFSLCYWVIGKRFISNLLLTPWRLIKPISTMVLESKPHQKHVAKKNGILWYLNSFYNHKKIFVQKLQHDRSILHSVWLISACAFFSLSPPPLFSRTTAWRGCICMLQGQRTSLFQMKIIPLSSELWFTSCQNLSA